MVTDVLLYLGIFVSISKVLVLNCYKSSGSMLTRLQCARSDLLQIVLAKAID